ncbi:MAG: hypothetical protein IT233_09190 [Bacteroidia bacterium]|nr:hypothetical protein [Bacteroidia bacterium]
MASRSSYSAVSANTLFHFTSGLDVIRGVLRTGFYPSYHREVLKDILRSKSEYGVSYVPMVCFCDIPLTRIKKHIQDYGSYGIGLSKKWGLKQKICPIIYVDKNSSTVSHIKKLTENLTVLDETYKAGLKQAETIDDDILDFENVMGELMHIYKYLKPYKRADTVFYDEREWRYVPYGSQYPVLWRGKFKRRFKLNKLLRKEAPLTFTPDEINYIIVKNNKEIPKMVDMINRLPDRPYTKNMKKILATKIITTEQLDKDFG